jgi:hypothetical protein
VVLLGILGTMLVLLSDNVRVRHVLSEAVGVPEAKREFNAQFATLQGNMELLLTKADAIAQTQNTATTERLALAARVAALETATTEPLIDTSPAIRFTPTGHSISDGYIGETVTIEYRFVKLRDCGRPTPDDFFVDAGGTLFRFEDVSIVDEAGRGVAVEPSPNDPQNLRYTATIPAGAGVEAGRASGWVVIRNYEHCPGVAAVASPAVPFEILQR